MRLTNIQEIAIKLLASSPLANKFYWTGGTLLAFHYLHHRRSLDLDFFSQQKFSYEEVAQVVEEISQKVGYTKVSSKRIFDRWEFLLENHEPLRIEFVYYNHEKKTLRKRNKLFGLYIDSLEDLAANKVMAYFDRNEPKDLFDIYFLIWKKGLTPQELLSLVQKKFGVEFAEGLFWSEAFKSLPLLSKLEPLLEGKAKEKNKLLRQIEAYFKDGSSRFLKKNLR